MVKKINIILISIVLVLSICGNVKAETGKTNLEVIEKSSEPKYFNDNNGYITKSIIECNSDNGEVTIESKYVNNTAKKNGTVSVGNTGIWLILDNSDSMTKYTKNGTTRKNELVSEIKKFVNYIYSYSSTIGIGLIQFSDSDSISILSDITYNKETILNKINEYSNSTTGGSTNIQKPLELANDKFNNECKNRIIILFSDGIPYQDKYTKGHSDASNRLHEVYDNTKNTLIEIQNLGTYIISIMADTNEKTEIVKYIFGTEEEPTAGSFYFTSTQNKEEILQKVITDTEEQIESTVVEVKNVEIEEYFPSEITDNFDFSYVGKPSSGNASDIDLKNRSITWNIDPTTKEATMNYKLKLKNMNNKEILNKVLPINENVEVLFEDEQENITKVTQTSTPKIRLTGTIEENEPENKPEEPQQTQETPKIEEKVEEKSQDETVIKKDIPTTGENILPITILSLIIGAGVVMLVKNNYIKIKKGN